MVRLGSPGSREQVASAIPVFITMPSSGATATGSVQESCLTCALAEAIAVREIRIGLIDSLEIQKQMS